MGLLDSLKGFFNPKTTRLDVSSRFELERHAFTGTMSKFHVARELSTGRRVGIKFLDREKTAQFEARFKGLKKPSEGEIGIQLKHPNIVETLEFGKTLSGQQYILMEYIDGPGLASLISDQSSSLDGVRLDFIRQMAQAIQAVHDAGFIHRDVCPRNFICNAAVDRVKLIDFGLTVPDKPEFRAPGNRTGTPQYMAPEIVRRRPTDRRVDIFALGISYYRLLTFAHPWGTTETTGLAALAHDSRPPTDIRDFAPDLDAKLASSIMRCIASNPNDRYASANQFLHSIRNVNVRL